MARKSNLKLTTARGREPDDANRGTVVSLEAQFRESLSPAQLEQYDRICAGAGEAVACAPTPQDGLPHRERLFAAFAELQTRITAEKLEQLLDNAVNKGDASTLRLLAMMAGLDLNTPAPEPEMQGAQVILIKPHPSET